MADAIEKPPLRWLLDTSERRRQALRYWVFDTFTGLLNFSLHFGLRLLPIDVCSAFGGMLGPFAKYRYRESDARARRAWARLRPNEADKASTDAAMKRLWRNVGRTMAEFSVLDRFWAAGRISVVGMEQLEAARATGRPLIFLGLHLGNWETIPVAMLAQGLRGASIYIPPENRFDHAIANRARDRIGGSYIKADRKAGFEALKTILKNKQNLLMYVDEFARDRVWAPAFGRPLRAEGNIAYILRIARMTNALIVPLYSIRLAGRAYFKVTVLAPLAPVETGDRNADLLANVAMIDALIDPIIRTHLDQWFYVLDFEFDR
jgi:Kdo2-lipid IVA lauroyltransferase/acyltransferase